jgi:hypothetical protein
MQGMRQLCRVSTKWVTILISMGLYYLFKSATEISEEKCDVSDVGDTLSYPSLCSNRIFRGCIAQRATSIPTLFAAGLLFAIRRLVGD